MKFGKSVDEDLQAIFIFHPQGMPGVERKGGGIDVHHYAEDYGSPPYRFRPFKQNGSRVWLRLLDPENNDQRFPDDDKYAPGSFIERRAYSSDLRRGTYWEKEI